MAKRRSAPKKRDPSAPKRETADQPHLPVLFHETVDMVDPQPGQTVVDGTFGAGGHA
ncbi:MAG: 16S rRNA (cytosine(1402)-N(4))-methyltransferase, partial [Patulibacter sp.]